MLYKNGVAVTRLSDPEAWGEYDRWLKEKENNGKKIYVFKNRRERKMNPTGYLEPLPVMTIPLKAILSGSKGREEWVYSTEPLKVINGAVELKEASIWLQESKIFNINDDPDLIFYLTRKSGRYKVGDFKLEDLEAEAAKEVAEKSLDSGLKFYLYNPASPIGKEVQEGEELMRSIAASWEVPNAATASYAEILLTLESKVVASENDKAMTGRGIQEFLKEVNVDAKMKVQILIQKAIDKKELEYSESSRGWLISNGRGDQKEVLLRVEPHSFKKRRVLLTDYLVKNSIAHDKIQIAVYGDTGIEETIAKTEAQLGKMKNMELKAYIQDELGIPQPGKMKSNVEYISIILEEQKRIVEESV